MPWRGQRREIDHVVYWIYHHPDRIGTIVQSAITQTPNLAVLVGDPADVYLKKILHCIFRSSVRGSCRCYD